MSSSASEGTRYAPHLYNLSIVNEALETLQISLIPEDKSNDSQYVEEKIQEVSRRIRTKLGVEQQELSTAEKVMQQFTSSFKEMNKTDQYRVLTSMPPDSSRAMLQHTFGVTERTARRAQSIQQEKGLLSTPNPKPGKRISEEVSLKAAHFYEDDKVSRQMAGKKDSVSVKIDGKKKHVQKRQILCTIYEAFLQFKEDNPDTKIGFSKFAEARPKHVVLPGATGTHNVCVCVHHQNPKLMIDHSQIKNKSEFKELVGEGEDNSYTGEVKYQHLLSKLMCNPPHISCWLGECSECEDTSTFERSLEDKFYELDIEQITYKQWESVDRTELVTHTDSVNEFVIKLTEKTSGS